MKEIAAGEAALESAAIGLEAEFEFYVDERPVRPERVFKDPQEIIRDPMMHRTGRSYHLPTGCAIYFDTGVIELATPAIEIAPGCAARAGRSLWEAILYLRTELDAWDRSKQKHSRLKGFSTHYNISFELSPDEQVDGRDADKLSHLLAYILPVPVMLLAANRESSGIGVRPRGNRIEVTADFTPSPALMIATATFITGVVRDVMSWRSFELDALEEHHIPIIEGFAPMAHTSRKGWLARLDCYPHNPFECDVNQELWPVRNVFSEGKKVDALSLRSIAGTIFQLFRQPIRQISDQFTYRLMRLVMNGRTTTLMDLPERPEAYEDVGRLCIWDNLFPEHVLRRSRYERVLIRAISGHTLRMNGESYTPIGLRGWSEVEFRRDRDGARRRVSFDRLLRYLRAWERA